jgi:hypothetical protein
LYDCDTNKQDEDNGIVFKRIIKYLPENIISKGIENLFPSDLIEKATKVKMSLIDKTYTESTIRGVTTYETTFIVNEDEKKNLCNWICSNATTNDFKNFLLVFDCISTIL